MLAADPTVLLSLTRKISVKKIFLALHFQPKRYKIKNCMNAGTHLVWPYHAVMKIGEIIKMLIVIVFVPCT